MPGHHCGRVIHQTSRQHRSFAMKRARGSDYLLLGGCWGIQMAGSWQLNSLKRNAGWLPPLREMLTSTEPEHCNDRAYRQTGHWGILPHRSQHLLFNAFFIFIAIVHEFVSSNILYTIYIYALFYSWKAHCLMWSVLIAICLGWLTLSL